MNELNPTPQDTLQNRTVGQESTCRAFKVYSSDGWAYETPSFVEAVEQLRYRLAKYGYPKVQDWLVDLVATNGDLSAGPWFYGHCGIETVEPTPDVLSLARTAGLRPFVWDNAELRGSTWVETDPAEGGADIWCSAVREPYGDETPQYFEVPVATWGDYCGSAVERSNFRSLVRDYPETFVEVRYNYFGNSLLIPVAVLESQEDPEELINLLTGLRDEYPLYDESDHSELETELADEAWDSWARYDLLRELREAGVADDVLDGIDDAELRERFYTAVWESDECPYAESADSIVFPMWDAVMCVLAEHYGESK